MQKFPVQFGKFVLLEQLGRGGMANVFRAATLGPQGFSKTIALKQIRTDLHTDADFVQMFVDEANILSHLNHQNICHVYEFGSHDDIYFLVMEYISGPSLNQINRLFRKKNSKLELKYILRIIKDICRGLDYAHNLTDDQGQPLNIVHRDLKPGNILISERGDVKIIDFGIAKAAQRLAETQVGSLKGTFHYMSPEQATSGVVDQRSDIFTVGLLFHELLTCQKVYSKKGDETSLREVIEANIEPPSTFVSTIPGGIDRIVMKALTPDPEERYQQISDLEQDIQSYIENHGEFCSQKDLKKLLDELFKEAYAKERQKAAHFASLPFDQIRSQSELSTSQIFGHMDSSDLSGSGKFSRFGATGTGLSSSQLLFSQSNISDISRIDHSTVAGKRSSPLLIALLFLLSVVILLGGVFFMLQHFDSRDGQEHAAQNTESQDAQTPAEQRPVPTALVIKSTPTGAEVQILHQDKPIDLDQEATPLVVTSLQKDERYLLRINKAGFLPYEREIIWNADSNPNLDISLKSLDGLIASAQPGAAKVEEETKPKPKASRSKKSSKRRSWRGKRKTTSKQPEPKPEEKPEPKPEEKPEPEPEEKPKPKPKKKAPEPPVKPEPKPEPKKAPEVKPEPKKPTYGLVRIVSESPGYIFINGQNTGKATPSNFKLDPGTYNITVVIKGSNTRINQKVRVKAGKRKLIRLKNGG